MQLRAPRSTLRAILSGVYLGLAICAVVMALQFFVADNFRVVVPGQIYRSSQLSQERLDKVARRHGIRTVINLRGYCPGLDWYKEEGRACNRLGVSQEDLGFSAGHLPPVTEIRRLVEVLDHCEYPILFHCFRGVDRTGLATVLALLLKTDTSYEAARRELALRHVHLPFGRTGHLDRFFNFYQDWLAKQGRAHSPDRFRHWVLNEYRGGPNTGEIALTGVVLAGPEQRRLFGPAGGPPPAPNEPHTVKLPRDLPTGVQVRLTNTSDTAWTFHPSDNTAMHAFLRLLSPQGELKHIGRAGRFHARVEPGQHIELILPVPALPPGRYYMQAGMLEEQHTFFQEVGMDLLHLELEVS